MSVVSAMPKIKRVLYIGLRIIIPRYPVDTNRGFLKVVSTSIERYNDVVSTSIERYNYVVSTSIERYNYVVSTSKRCRVLAG